MPTYDYECGNCGHHFEQFQSITARPTRKCPQCGKLRLQRLIGAGAGVIFKGSGFYQTDYRSESYKNAAKAETDGGTDKTGKEKKETKAETKSDAKSETKSEPKKSKKKTA
jgi:putative FmdB family regulatory protein